MGNYNDFDLDIKRVQENAPDVDAKSVTPIISIVECSNWLDCPWATASCGESCGVTCEGLVTSCGGHCK